MNDELNQVKALIKANKLHQARQQLELYLKANPENAQGWYLASFLQPTHQARLAAIQRAGKLKPTQPDIRERLTKLQSAGSSRLKFPRIVILGVVAAVAISATILVALNARPATDSSALPTLAVLQAVTGIPTQPTNTPENQRSTATIATTDTPVLQPTIAPTELPSQPFAATETLFSPQPTLAIQSLEASPVSSLPAPLPLIVASPAATHDAVTPTLSNTVVATVPPPTPTFASTPATGQSAVPLNTGIQIPNGEFRVVDATRNAERLIQDLGGSFPPAPANQSWMLLELLLVCQNGATCAFDPSVLKVVSSSGAMYSYSPQLNLTPIFGTITANNQIWGYLGFVLPTSESTLNLTFAQNDQTYAFSLV